MPWTLGQRDPTNPIAEKLDRDRELRGEAGEESEEPESWGWRDTLWDRIAEPIIEGVGLVGLLLVLAVVAGAIYVWVSIFLLDQSPF